MAKGRIAYVVRQAGGLNDLAQMVRRAAHGQVAALPQGITHAKAKGSPHAAHLKRMGKAVVDMVVAHQRVHLGFSCQPAE